MSSVAKESRPAKRRQERNQILPAGGLTTPGLWPLLIFPVTFLVFFPALENGFVDWDDDKNVLENPHYRGLGWNQLRWMFTTFHQGHYQPLSWLTLGLDYLVWGMDPSSGQSLLARSQRCRREKVAFLIPAIAFGVIPIQAQRKNKALLLLQGYVILRFF